MQRRWRIGRRRARCAGPLSLPPSTKATTLCLARTLPASSPNATAPSLDKDVLRRCLAHTRAANSVRGNAIRRLEPKQPPIVDEIVARGVGERRGRIEAVEGARGHVREPANGESHAVRCVRRDLHTYLCSDTQPTSRPRTRRQTRAAGPNYTSSCSPVYPSPPPDIEHPPGDG